MEQCFRIALWMCLLIAYLQAGPLNRTVRSTTSCIAEEDMGFDHLKGQDISSTVVNVTFECPDEPEQCYAAAAKVYIQELGKIKDHPVTGVKRFASDAEKTLNRYKERCLGNIDTDCNFNKTVPGNMTSFVKALKEFVNKIITEN